MKITDNIQSAKVRTLAVQRAIAAPNNRTFKQRLSNQVASEGVELLRKVTAMHIGQKRWGVSGLASQRMGGPPNLVDNSWQTKEVTPDRIVWSNRNPIYSFLDRGTSAHGPRNATMVSPTSDRSAIRSQRKVGAWYVRDRAKRLFIPLTEKAARAYYGGELHGFFGRLMQTHQFGRGKRKGQKARRELVYGVDYVLARWVRGITPRHITETVIPMLHNAAQGVLRTLNKELQAALRKESKA